MKDISTIKTLLLKPIVILLQKSALLSALSCRLVQWTGKHPDPIHPKHLVQIRKPWYLAYIKNSDVVLDIGCNNGQHTLKIAKKCQYIIGFDYNKKMLALARREVQRLHISNAQFHFGDAQKTLPHKNRHFDVVVFLDVFEHLGKRTLILKEIKRVLKKGGILLISVPNSNTSWKKLQKSLELFYFSDPDHKIEFTKEKIIKILQKSGFEVIKLFPVTLDTPLVGFIDLLGGLSMNLYSSVARWRRDQALKYPDESIGFEIVARKL